MSGRHAVVIGGTGMLAGLVDSLAEQGDRVVVPSRHPGDSTSQRVEVRGEWSQPQELAAAVEAAAEGPITLAVIWCHQPHRDAVTAALSEVLSPGATVVQVLGSVQITQLWQVAPDARAVHVFLGHVPQPDGTSRRLRSREISDGVLGAIDRPLGSTVVVGSLD